jgi:four helix bundle protein
MEFAKRFEDLEIWQESRRLNRIVYFAAQSCNDYGYRNQITRAALSVMSNIAEGFERKTTKDFAHFLDFSKASSGEVRSISYALEDISVWKKTKATDIRADYEILSKRIAKFQSHLR